MLVWGGSSKTLRLSGDVASRADFRSQAIGDAAYRLIADLNDHHLKVLVESQPPLRGPASLNLSKFEPLSSQSWRREDLESGRVRVVIQAP